MQARAPRRAALRLQRQAKREPERLSLETRGFRIAQASSFFPADTILSASADVGFWRRAQVPATQLAETTLGGHLFASFSFNIAQWDLRLNFVTLTQRGLDALERPMAPKNALISSRRPCPACHGPMEYRPTWLTWLTGRYCRSCTRCTYTDPQSAKL